MSIFVSFRFILGYKLLWYVTALVISLSNPYVSCWSDYIVSTTTITTTTTSGLSAAVILMSDSQPEVSCVRTTEDETAAVCVCLSFQRYSQNATFSVKNPEVHSVPVGGRL